MCLLVELPEQGELPFGIMLERGEMGSSDLQAAGSARSQFIAQELGIEPAVMANSAQLFHFNQAFDPAAIGFEQAIGGIVNARRLDSRKQTVQT